MSATVSVIFLERKKKGRGWCEGVGGGGGACNGSNNLASLSNARRGKKVEEKMEAALRRRSELPLITKLVGLAPKCQ